MNPYYYNFTYMLNGASQLLEVPAQLLPAPALPPEVYLECMCVWVGMGRCAFVATAADCFTKIIK